METVKNHNSAKNKKKVYERPELKLLKLIAEALQKTCLNTSEGCNDDPSKVIFGG